MPRRSLKIAVSTPTFLPIVGGAEVGIHEIYRRIGLEHDVTIVTPPLRPDLLAAHGSAGSDYQPENYTVRYITPRAGRLSDPMGRAFRRTSLAYLWELYALDRESSIDVLNPHFVEPQGASIITLARIGHKPTVLSLVGRTDVIAHLGPVRKAVARAAVRSAHAVVPNSAYYLKGEKDNPGTVVIPYGVDCAEFSPSRRSPDLRQRLGFDPDAVVLFTAQRLAEIKRVDELIHVVGEVSRRDPRVRLVIAGQGPERPRLEALVHHLGLDDLVTFAGYVAEADLGEFFAMSDVFVFHSLFETFGIVFAQAMASGLPIVAARTSCVPDVVRSGENGLLVEPFDRTSFAEAILSLAADVALRTQIAQQNRSRALSEFNWDAIADRYERLLVETAAIR